MKRMRLFTFAFAVAAIAWVIFVDPSAAMFLPAVIGVTIATGTEDTSTILANKRIIDMAMKIAQLEPTETPLIVLLKRAKKKKAINHKIEWLENELLPITDQVAGAVLAAATTFNVDNGTYFNVGDVVRAPSTQENMLVTAISTNQLTVTRSYGETAAADLADNAFLWIIGNVYDENAAAPTAKTTKEVAVYNFTQEFRHVVNGSDRMAASGLYGGAHRPLKRKQRGIEHMRAIELAFWFGERNDGTTKTTTRGIEKFLTTNITDCGGTITETLWETFLRDGFRYGAKRKFFFGSRFIMSAISSWAQGKLQMVPSDKTYGIAINRYRSPHGEVMLIPHPLFTGSEAEGRYGGWGALLDMESITYRFLQTRDTKLYADIQNPDVTGWKDEYRTDAGLMLQHERRHAIIRDVFNY